MYRAKRPRQDPVSCQLCRRKKLKCDRQLPCSNCKARGVSCALATGLSRSPVEHSTTGTAETVGTVAILARLQRLEDIVLRVNEVDAAASSTRSFRSTPLADSLEHGVEDAHQTILSALEHVSTEGYMAEMHGTANFVCLVGPMQPHFANNLKSIWLPPKQESIKLFEYYTEKVNHIHNLVYMPFVRQIWDDVYEQLSSHQQPQLAHLALIFSILASSARGMTDLFPSSDMATQMMLAWIGYASDILDHSRRTSSPSLEDIQANIILSFLAYNIEGAPARSRSLWGSTISMARELSLHKLDGSINKSQTMRTQKEIIEYEIKRRVWWYLASSDWLFAFMGGPQCMTYFIQPKHMIVRYPRNVHDEDLAGKSATFERPMSEPTSMSYFLLRVRFSELCRDIVDVASSSMSKVELIDYNEVIALDGKIEKLLHELPVHFRIDEKSLLASQEIDCTFPQIANQRYSINSFAHCRRIRLHQPFLIRSSLDPRYGYSRNMCLQSACKVIQVTSLLGNGKSPFGLAHESSFFVIQHLFLATVALVMDLCFNKGSGQAMQRRREVTSVCKTLEKYKENSPVAGKYLDSLKDVLRKHNIHLKDSHIGSPATESRRNDGDCVLQNCDPEPNEASPRVEEEAMDFDFDFDETWKSCFDTGRNLDAAEWDEIFFDLDSFSA